MSEAAKVKHQVVGVSPDWLQDRPLVQHYLLVTCQWVALVASSKSCSAAQGMERVSLVVGVVMHMFS